MPNARNLKRYALVRKRGLLRHRRRRWNRRQALLHPELKSIVTVVAVVMVWRGVWRLLDRFLFPSSPLLSTVACLTLGLAILWLDDRGLDELS